MCGKDTTLTDGIIEGTVMRLCSGCMKYAKPVPKKSVVEKRSNTGTKVPFGRRQAYSNIKEMESKEHIVDNYPELIKSKRQKLQIPQKALAVKLAEKESVIHSLETGKHEPSIALAKKIEKLLGIKLVTLDEPSDEDILKKLASGSSSKKDSMTLGDSITIRRRK
ncbi:MAG: helix-turn-helix domain-containing protein [Nanoarchaeota archaeon]